MSKHTPGPWSVIPYGGIGAQGEHIQGFDIGCEIGRDGFHKIAKLETSKYSRDEQANANLIAAAPDLLEALESARTYVEWAYGCAFPDAEKNIEILVSIDAAISKAKGESQ